MKKQNANNKLAFNKVAVTELNDNQMYDVEGGISTIILPLSIVTLVTLL